MIKNNNRTLCQTTMKKNDAETIFSQKLLENLTFNYKEMASLKEMLK